MASPGKVLIIVENLPVPFDRRVWMEATTLQRAGYEVSIICPVGKGYEAPYEVLEGIHIYRHPLPPEGQSAVGYAKEYGVAIRHELKLAKKVKKERGFDVVHICNPPDLLFLVALRHKVFGGARVIFDQHDINPELYEAKYGKRGFFYWVLRLWERMTFATADVVISTNESYREVALTRGKKKAEDVAIVRSGPDLSRFVTAKAEGDFRRGRKYLVGYVGVMGSQEGIDYLLRSIEHIVKKDGRQDIQFQLIGGGPSVAEMKELSVKMGLADYVEFTGRISDKELIARLASCDVCVNPDPKNEFNDKSTMNKILEYMALGKPIVQFDLTEGRRSAESASLYAKGNDERDFADKILQLLADEQMRATMGEIGRQRMEKELEWRHQGPKLLSIYERVFRLVKRR